tara:strand:- start:856 stop:1722 length:867 start_codon:yes stop_codon:yes gene_type:complete
MSSLTTNKSIEKPAYNEYAANPTGWSSFINADWDIIDRSFGGSQVLVPTGLPSQTITLTSAEYQPAVIVIGQNLSTAGVLSGNLVYSFPSGVGGVWSVFNNTTGAFTVTFSSAGGGTSVVVSQGVSTTIFCDGTNVRLCDDRVSNAAPGSNTQVLINSSGSIGAASGLTTTGGTLTASVGFVDAIGNVRNVPLNSQTASYVLVASDSGKVISITTGGVTVNSGIFSASNTISIYNNSASSQAITQGSGTTLRLAGTTTTGTRTLLAYGLMTLVCVGGDVFVATGAGLT